MKKSKIIVPALGLLALTTAASVVGTVAWFTASRTATIKAGKFAVVDVSDNMKVTLAAGVGTSVDNDTKEVSVGADYKLTDSSFNHTNTTMPEVVTPDVPRKTVLKTTALNNGSLAGELLRGTNVYSAFTWKMTFEVDFSAAATKDQGLFLDLSADSTYMHKVFSFTHTAADTAASVDANKHEVTADEALLEYFSDPLCDTDHKVTLSAGTEVSTSTVYYLASPVSSGKGFRLAFVPTAIGGTGTGTSIAYSKIWADNEGTISSGADAGKEGRFINVGAGALLENASSPVSPVSYSEKTIKRSGNGTSSAFAAVDAGTNLLPKVFMKNGDNTAVPTDDAVTESDALSGNTNYLGMFKCDAGKSVQLEYTVVAWFEGTHPYVDADQETILETVTSSMHFGVANLHA